MIREAIDGIFAIETQLCVLSCKKLLLGTIFICGL